MRALCYIAFLVLILAAFVLGALGYKNEGQALVYVSMLPMLPVAIEYYTRPEEEEE